MQSLGNLGSILAQAAKESDSSLAVLITNQKQTIEKEQKTRLQAVSEKNANRRRPKRRRPQQKKDIQSQKTASTES
jgi:hypothetical protein